MHARRAIAVNTKSGVDAISASIEALCSNPCRYRLVPDYVEWRPGSTWGVSRYKSLMLIDPLYGIAGGTPLYCPSNYCYKLETVGPFTGFWDRGAETLAAHMSLCGATVAWTRRGPWLQSLRAYARRVSILEADGLGGEGYCADVLHNPFFHEGGATLVYEVYEQMGEPDAIIAPGYAALLESIRVGLERLLDLGVVEEAPRIYAVDMGIGIPRWLVDSLDAVEVVVKPHSVERGYRSLNMLGFVDAEPRVEAARLELLESGEIGRDERVAVILVRAR